MGLIDWILKTLTGGAAKPAPTKQSATFTITMSGGVSDVSPEEAAAREAAAQRERIANSRRPKPPMPMDISMVRVGREEDGGIVRASWDEYVQAHYASTDVQCYRLKLENGQPGVVLFSPEGEWIHVLTPGKLKDYADVPAGRFKAYGFNRDRSSWSYGDGPVGAKAIRTALRTLDPAIQSRERM